ncbi:MAG: hypothetical protein HXY44_09115 [Syntrophaceae bacterium]|nr:hypothetical protein [Syntrophaceae bacterium]
MKRAFPFLLFVLFLSLFSASLSSAQVQVRLRVFEASNVGSRIDSSLRDMRDQFKPLVDFSSYRLLKDETPTLYPNRPVISPAHPGRVIELTLIRQDKNVAEVRVKIKREQRDILDTQVRLSPGRTVSIGGPKHGEGVIIVTLSGQF